MEFLKVASGFLLELIATGVIANMLAMSLIAVMARFLSGLYASSDKKIKATFLKSVYCLYIFLIVLSFPAIGIGYLDYLQVQVKITPEDYYVDKAVFAIIFMFYYVTVIINILIGSWLAPLYLWKRFYPLVRPTAGYKGN